MRISVEQTHYEGFPHLHFHHLFFFYEPVDHTSGMSKHSQFPPLLHMVLRNHSIQPTNIISDPPFHFPKRKWEIEMNGPWHFEIPRFYCYCFLLLDSIQLCKITPIRWRIFCWTVQYIDTLIEGVNGDSVSSHSEQSIPSIRCSCMMVSSHVVVLSDYLSGLLFWKENLCLCREMWKSFGHGDNLDFSLFACHCLR